MFILKSVFTVFNDHKQVIRQFQFCLFSSQFLQLFMIINKSSWYHKLNVKLKVLLILDLDNFGDDWRVWFQSWTKGLSSPKAE